MPLISIITPVLNRVEFIAQAIESVADQHCDVAVEHIIVDGGSVDGTQDVVRQYRGVQLVERLDGGLYGAINRGIDLSSGSYIGLLNSDDAYLPGAFALITAALEKAANFDSVAGGALFSRWEHDETLVRSVNDEASKMLRLRVLAFDSLIINARFFNRDWLSRIGPFDESYNVAGDREFLWRCIAGGMRTLALPDIIYRYRIHSGSKTLNDRRPQTNWRSEHLKLTRALLRTDLPQEMKRTARRWHGIESLRYTMECLRGGDFGAAREGVGAAFETDVMWLMAPAREASVRAYDKLRKAR